MKHFFHLIFALFNLFVIQLYGQDQNVWSRKAATDEYISNHHSWVPDSYIYYELDLEAIKRQLLMASDFQSPAAKPIVIGLPMPDGEMEQFSIYEIPVMHPELQSAFPGIRTFGGNGIENPLWSVRCDFTQFGFHATINTPEGIVIIDPLSLTNIYKYLVFYRHQSGQHPQMICGLAGEKLQNDAINQLEGQTANRSTTNQLRTYRLALACTGEYAAYYGGTKAGALAGMVTSVNRVDGIYMRELDAHLVLIPNDTLLIYLNSATDPYTNGSGGTMLGQNQTNVTAVIGSANYDIGHVFSTGGGGVANLSCVCSSTNKARGVTGSSNPVNDPFDVDYVAHEMGHQFGGNHTFNSVTGSCNGNRSASHAYEPGSGITIQAYAGICGSDNLAPNSIAYFHTHSFDEMYNFITLGNGNTCPVNTPNGNTAPVIDSLTTEKYIPYLTAFRLQAYGHDPDVEPIDFSWEQYDLGPSGTWNAPSGNAPMYRSNAPSSSGLRLFPKLSNILSNVISPGEIYPTYSRDMKFRVTLRDERNTGGGVTYNDTAVLIHVVNVADTFKITYPNGSGISLQQVSCPVVTWKVAGTTSPPISATFVNILLSIDGGNSFPYLLASNVPNTGSYAVNFPAGVSTNTARIMVEGAGNIFIDINDNNFSITNPLTISGNVPFCAGSSIVLDAGAGYSAYNWSNGSTSQTTSVSSAGTFSVTVTDINGCTGSTTVVTTTTVCCSISLSAVAGPVLCSGGNDGAIDVTSSATTGTASYLWDDGATTEDRTGLASGTYTVTVTYAPGCFQSQAFTVSQPDAITVTGVKSDVICKGSNTGSITITPAGGIPSYSYLWNNGSTSQNRTSLVAGTYVVTVTDANGCTKKASFAISQPATNLILNSNKTNVRCNGGAGGKSTVTPSGGIAPYTYSWNTIPVKTTASVSGLIAGVYSCTVTDANGCTKTTTITITQPPVIVSIKSQINVSTNGGNDGSASVSVSGGTAPYTFFWNTVPSSTNDSVSGLTAGTYVCKITDSKGCVKKSTFIITQPGARTAIKNRPDRLSMYPNPTDGTVNLIFSAERDESYVISIFDFSGKELIKQKGLASSGDNRFSLDLGILSKGIYILKLQSDRNVFVEQVILH